MEIQPYWYNGFVVLFAVFIPFIRRTAIHFTIETLVVTSITLDWIVSGGDICVNSRTFSNKMDWYEMSLSFWPSILIVWGSGLNDGLPKLVSFNGVWFATPSAYSVDRLRPRQDGHHFPDDIFKYIFLNGNAWILIMISLRFVPKGIINNIPSSVQIMAWRRSASNWQYSIIGSDNGLAPIRRQAIVWTNDGLVWWHIYASLVLNEFNCCWSHRKQ